MRTVNLRDDVLYPAAHLLGIDPQLDLNRDHAQAFTSFANGRIREGWEFWLWPELNITEERAYRTIWKSTRQFQLGDELFYIPSLTYFTAIATPPVGTLPTDTNYFAALDVINRYIANDQIGKRPIGQVWGVANGNPFTADGAVQSVPSAPSENGTQILNGYTGPTAWINYRIRESKFTSIPYDPVKVYNRGNLVYWSDGDCYEALVTSFAGHSPAELSYWRKVPVPYFLANYLRYGIAADACDDLNNQQIFEAKALNALQNAADRLQEQGQKAYYKRPHCCGYLSFKPLGAPTAQSGTTLTDEDDPYAEQGVLMLADGLQQINSGQAFVDVDLAANNWTGGPVYSFDELVVKNTVDSPPLGIFPMLVVSQNQNGFRVLLNAAPDNNNYHLKWRVTL